VIGTIKTLLANRGYGFIHGEDGLEYFFHEDDQVDDFELKAGDRVSFERVEPAPLKGLRAREVALQQATQ
jgi:cold shock CspA family protein